jgi:hypothetical protein
VHFQPIDVPSLLRAITWPVIVIVAFFAFRRPLGELVGILGRNVRKFSFGGFSLELAEVSEIKPPQALDTEIRQLEAGLYPQSGVSGLTVLLNQLQHGGQHNYIVIDLGSDSSPRWLTSRLYLLAFLITLIDRDLCLMFVETIGGLRKRFVGLASPSRVRWALARTYGWLETAAAGAYATMVGNFRPEPTTGFLSDIQLSQLVQLFLQMIRVPSGTVNPGPDAAEWVTMPNQMAEHTKWLDGSRIERLLGSDLNTSYIVLPPNKTVNDLTNVVMNQQGRFVALVDLDKTFRGLIDRSTMLDNLSNEVVKQAESNKS